MNATCPADATGHFVRTGSAWLALAASPTFAIMTCVSVWSAPSLALCSPPSSILPIDAMSAMYGLMSLFHLSPWLRLGVDLSAPSERRPSARRS